MRTPAIRLRLIRCVQFPLAQGQAPETRRSSRLRLDSKMRAAGRTARAYTYSGNVAAHLGLALKTKRLFVRLTDAESDSLKEKASRTGLTMSSFLRQSVLREDTGISALNKRNLNDILSVAASIKSALPDLDKRLTREQMVGFETMLIQLVEISYRMKRQESDQMEIPLGDGDAG